MYCANLSLYTCRLKLRVSKARERSGSTLGRCSQQHRSFARQVLVNPQEQYQAGTGCSAVHAGGAGWYQVSLVYKQRLR